MTKFTIPRVLPLLLLLCMTLLTVSQVSATTIKLWPGGCRLDQAILAANRDSREGRCSVGSGADTIVLQRSLVLEKELPIVKSNITIDGNGYSIFFRSWHRAFDIRDGHLTLKDIKIRYRDRGRGNRAAVNVSNGSLRIINSSFSNCSGAFYVHNSTGEMQGNDWVCGHQADAVNSWFAGPPAADSATSSAEARVNTCESLSSAVATVTARYGASSGIQCNHVGAAGIGNQAVIDAGFISAVDLWGYVEQGVEICFPQAGKLMLIETSVIPRRHVSLDAFSRDGHTCAAVNTPGIVVLSPGPAQPAQAPEPASAPSAPAQPAQPAAAATSGCQVTTTGNVRLRETAAMGDNVIGYVMRGTTLSANSLATWWVQVNHEGRTGWISSNWVTMAGHCAYG